MIEIPSLRVKNKSMPSSSRKEQVKKEDPRLRKMQQFGGPLLNKSNAKTARPLSTKHAMHLVLRSSLAKGAWSLKSPKNQKRVQELLRHSAKEFKVSILEFANAGDHLHLMIRMKSRKAFMAFVRSFSGALVIGVTGACKGNELKKKFWDYRPWTRIVELVRRYSLGKDDFILDYLLKLKILERRGPSYGDLFIREGPLIN